MIGKMLSSVMRRDGTPVAPGPAAAPAPTVAAPVLPADSQPVPAASGQSAAPAAAAASVNTFFHELMTSQLLVSAILAEPACQDPKRLEKFGWKAYSQNEEDGILQEIFRRIGVRHRSFVEFGCGYGLENNSAYLLAQGWRGLWMDGDEGNANSVNLAFSHLIRHGLLQFQRVFITRENIDGLIAAAGLGPEIDLLSIDLDGNDYYVWDAIGSVSARVVVVEYNAKFRPPFDWSIPYDAEQVWDGSDRMGSSLAALARLGESKGYQLVGCNIAGVNAFFVRRDLAGDLFAAPATPEQLYQPPRYFLTRYFYAGQPGNSYTVVEAASLRAQLPWPPETSFPSIMLGDPAKAGSG